ncbi:MAG TPA: pitrilysin family protein [Candidatus Binatia bacterium]|nr:pitrilysin family protein [Candidatus Binatia bacterium]
MTRVSTGWLVAAAVASVLGACAAPGTGVSTAPGTTPITRPTREVLGNGVVLITQEHRAADVVSLQMWMRVGGRDEAPDELGLSHYLEHMLFKGTPTRPPGSIDREIEGMGGSSNAFTSYDYTHFDVVVPAAHVKAGLELLADIGVNAAFVPAELEAEKKVVFEEMNLTEDDPEKFLGRRLSEVAYRGHPYGRPILGTRELIRALNRERLNAYYKKQYVPQNMTLVVIGPLTAAQVRPLAEATFGRLAGPPAPKRSTPPLPSLEGGRRDDVPRPEQQAYLGLAWYAAATKVASEDIPAVDLLTSILGDGPSSRLNQTVREQKKLVHSIEAAYVTREQSGTVSITARLDAKNLDAAEAAIMEVVRKVRTEGVTEAERQRVIVTAESSYAFDIETAEGLARSYGQAETTWTLDNELAYLGRLRGITAAQIQAAARKYLGDNDMTRVRFLPKGAK